MSDHEQARLKELYRYAILDTASEPRFDRITRLASRLFGAPMAGISLVDADRQWFKSRLGIETPETAREISFCTHAIGDDNVMVVPDASLDPRMASNPLVTGNPGICFYAGAPLITAGGFRLGTLSVMDHVPRPPLTGEQVANLADLAALVVDELELRLAEKERAEAGRLFTSVFETAPIGIAILDEGARHVHVNPAYCRLFGYDAGELTGGGFWTLLPEEREQARSGLAAFPDGDELAGTRRVLTKEGAVIDVLIHHSPLVTGDGRRLRVTAVTDLADIRRAETALRESNQRMSQLAAIINSSNDAILSTNAEGVITSWNAGAERIYGYSAEEMIGRSIGVLVPDDMQGEHQLLLDKIARGEDVSAFETVRVRKGDHRIHVSLSISPVRDPEGIVTGASAIARDITRRKLLEEQLIQSQKMEAVALLAGGIAHDFNNLLTVIVGYGRMLRTAELGEGDSAREFADEILHSADRASALTRQLLAFSRKQVAKPRLLDLNEIVESMHKMLGRILGEHMELRTIPGAGLWSVKADPGQIEQVIANLAVNARDAMPGGGKLTIETGNVELSEEYVREHFAVSAGEYVMLAVSDTGAGMPPEVARRIFEPFFTTKEKGKGTGLGLSIIHGIVKQSGGEIRVYSEFGLGTTFKIYLPRVREAGEPWRHSSPGSPMPAGSETVLVVEDEAAVRKLARQILKRLGYDVLEAADGQKALDLCGSHTTPIHLLLTDVVMPGITGVDLAGAVRLLHPETKVIFMSGYTDNSILRQELIDPGANFLQKPFIPEELAQRVREVLDREETGSL